MHRFSMDRCIRALIAAFGLFAVLVFLAPSSDAQGSGGPASISSSGSGGRAVVGTVPTGPVHPPTGTVPPAPSGSLPKSHIASSLPAGSERHHHDAGFAPVFYPVPIPYAVDLGSADAYAGSDADDQDANYQGGPTVFDRRGSGEESYVPPVSDGSEQESADRASDITAAADPPEPTTLVFKDGHKLDVENYAIIGQMLLDLTPGHTRRVPLADLDLGATREENDERGIVFQVPQTSQVN
jgi:hypothetical protein